MRVVETLRYIELFVFVGLAIIAGYRWYRRGGVVRLWMAASFSTLAVVCTVGIFLPQDQTTHPPVLLMKALVILILLFPYLLYRFMSCFTPPAKWIQRLVSFLTVGSILMTLIIQEFPLPDEPRSAFFQVFVLMVTAQWLFLLGVVSVKLWRGGRGQGTIARKRMRTLSMGSTGIAIALIMTVLNRQGNENHLFASITLLTAILSAPLFLMGFAPPAAVIAVWRREERVRFREAEGGLIEAVTQKDVADVLLPLVADYIGGSGSLLASRDEQVIAYYGFTEEHAAELARGIAHKAQTVPDAHKQASTVVFPMHDGWLLIEASVFAPYFGKEESSLLQSLASFTDMALTRAKVTEAQMDTAEELRIKNIALRDFVAMASHDLRAPLNVIRSYTGALQGEWNSESSAAQQEYLAVIDRQAAQLSHLVDDLLTVSKLDANAVVNNPTRVGAKSAVDQVLTEVDLKSSEVISDIEPGLEVLVDPDHLNRILHNYLENAAKYGSSPITIEAFSQGDTAVFRIIDSGEGISEDFLPYLFERFSRGSNSQDNPGTGLGLAIVRGLASNGGGEAWYEPNTPKGSCFSVRCPLYVSVPDSDGSDSSKTEQLID